MRRLLWGLVILLIILFAVFCCVNAHSWNSNLVSMISGLWSAVATVILGIIAVWQNKRYTSIVSTQ